MCFSAAASFSVAAATLKQVKHPRELPLATVPLLFAFQQAVEGVLWLQLSGESNSENIAVLSFIFLIFAEVLWPSYAALAVHLIEPDRRRRRILCAFAVIGPILSIYLLIGLIGDPLTADIRGHSIDYGRDVTVLSWIPITYLLCTCVPPLLSSHRIIQVFGAVVLVGFLAAAYVYLATFISVWCFFAAADSSLLFFYFKRAAVGVRLHQH